MEKGSTDGEKKWRFRILSFLELEKMTEHPKGCSSEVWRQETDPGWVPIHHSKAEEIISRGGFQRVGISQTGTEKFGTKFAQIPKNE